LINILNFYDRHVSGALTEPVKIEFNLSDTQLGLLGSAFIWLYAIVGVPFGHLADRTSRKTILAWGVVIWSALTAFNAYAQNYTHLMISRLGVAVGEAVVAPTATSWIGDLLPSEKRARALALFMLGVPIGGALSYFLSGPAAQAWGWRTAMVLAAAPALALVPALLFLKEPARGAADQVAPTAGPKPSMWSVLRIPTMWWIIASGALLNFCMYAYGNFLVSFLIRVHGESLARAGVVTGLIYAVGGISGGYIAGYIGDRIIRTRANGRLLAAALISALGAPLAYIGIISGKGELTAAAIFLALGYGACNTYYGLVYSSIQDIVAPQLRASAMSIYFMFMYICGASMGPLLTGAVSDWRARVAAEAAGSATITAAHKALGLQQAMLAIPVLGLLLAVVLWAGSRTIAADMERKKTALDAAAVSA
jgi:MFS family permease